jgi:hypothetical protein
MDPESVEIDILEITDRILSAALREVRGIRARRPVAEAVVEVPDIQGVSKSQTSLSIDILKDAGRPMHISALLGALDARGVQTTRESLVSAVCKKLKKLASVGPFVRTAPNTFGLAGRDAQEV